MIPGKCPLIALLFFLTPAHAAEVIPPPPTRYFTDYAHVITPGKAAELDATLERFERDTSSQIVVAVFPKMQSDSSIEDYSQRVFEAWKAGRAKLDQGALLLVFMEDRKLRIHTGYGLEGALPDALGKRIIDDEITPRFKSRDFDGGMTAGVNAMLAAARGEYQGTGRTVRDEKAAGSSLWAPAFFVFFLLFVVLSNLRPRTRTVYSPLGRRTQTYWGWAPGSSSGGGWSSGGGGGGGGGGGFSGGGGSSGGGGASGSW